MACGRVIAVAALMMAAMGSMAAEFSVVGDAAPQALAGPGDAARGRALVAARESANCVLCHAVPGVRFAGDLGPPLAGVASRLSPGQLRLRVADIARVNPASAMPSYYRTDGLDRVAPTYAGQPILTAQEVEDVVAYLGTLQ
ncbi:MAG: sulfur oxidation c-type cytochrome SoxX [Burkholderiales bacterium]|nr:sulfur oxidation c-type cytochrome SoxX [Burkholderiales bacterium]